MSTPSASAISRLSALARMMRPNAVRVRSPRAPAPHQGDVGEGKGGREGPAGAEDKAGGPAPAAPAARPPGAPRAGRRGEERGGGPAPLRVPADRRDPDVGAERVEGA